MVCLSESNDTKQRNGECGKSYMLDLVLHAIKITLNHMQYDEFDRAH